MKYGPLEFLPLDQFGEKYAAESKWLIPGWVPEGELIMLCGAPKQGKSWLILEIAVAVSTGSKFMGKTPMYTGPVLHLQLEDSPRTTNFRFDLILANKTGHTDRNVELRPKNIHVLVPGNFSLQDNADMTCLQEAVKAIKPRLIIIDSLYCAVSFDDWGVRAAKAIKDMKTICVEHELSIILCHHTKKSAVRSAEGMLGSQLLNSCVDGSIHIRSMEVEGGEDILTIERIWKSFASNDREELVLQIETETSYHYDSFTRVLSESPRASDDAHSHNGDHHGIPGLR